MLTFTQLREQLGLSQPALTKLINDGLPHTLDGRVKVFEGGEVARWLVDTGRAIKAVADGDNAVSKIARTRRECADHFGVHLRTVADWLEDSSFPGRSGTRGHRDGHFPLEEIDKWLRSRDAVRSGGPDVANARDELYALRLERGRYEFEQYKQNLVTLDAVKSENEKLINTAKKILESMPEKAAAAIPEDMPADVRANLIERWRDCVYEIERTLSEAIALATGDDNDCD